MRRSSLRRSSCSLLIGCLVVGCAAGRPLPNPSDAAIEPDEGIVVLHVRSNTEIDRLDFGVRRLALRIEPGETFVLYAMPEGEYEWSGVRVVAGGSFGGPPLRFRAVERVPFRVEAGHINFIGAFDFERSGWFWMSSRLVDRTAWSLDRLREEFPGLIGRYPLVYGGRARHEFLGRYLPIAETEP